jgi:hypothetical protein
MPQVQIKSMTVEIFDSRRVFAELATLASKREVKTIYAFAADQGFTPLTAAKNVQGFRRTYVPDTPVIFRGESLKKLEYSYQIQEMRKSSSQDMGVVIITTFNGNVADSKETDVRFLIAPGGDIDKAKEVMFDPAKNKVVPTKSLWTRFRKCLGGKCASVCTGAVASCPKVSWAAFLGCLALACGGCSAKCFGCASCNCRWWCKWAVGCCKD